MPNSKESDTLDSICSLLVQGTSLAHPPQRPQDARLTAVIADLHVHPTLEALLHILNHDLPSAHFLVRHMQAPPAVEGMLLHGALHRAEGDFNNARAWIGDVKDACEGFQPKKKYDGIRLDGEVAEKVQGGHGMRESLIEYVYGGEDPLRLIDAVEGFRNKKQSERETSEGDAVEERIRREAEKVMEWCKIKFGSTELVDASQAWVKNSEVINQMSTDMVSGNKGYRKF